MSAPIPDIYLASRSPRRRELLDQIGVRHQPISVAVPELRREGESPADYVQRLAKEKSLAGLVAVEQQGLVAKPVLGADTLVVCDGQVMEKPASADDAALMLRQLSGRSHEVMT